MATTNNLYTQAEADCNVAAVNMGRPAVMKQETLRDRTRLWKVGCFDGKEGVESTGKNSMG